MWLGLLCCSLIKYTEKLYRNQKLCHHNKVEIGWIYCHSTTTFRLPKKLGEIDLFEKERSLYRFVLGESLERRNRSSDARTRSGSVKEGHWGRNN